MTQEKDPRRGWKVIRNGEVRIKTPSGRVLIGKVVSHFKAEGEDWVLLRSVKPPKSEF